MEKISIIIPVYNVEKYLARCLESIVNQTYKNIEIIVIDDGSTDESGRICDEFAKKDNRIIVIHKKNGGVSEARNAGLGVCHGEYIGFVDPDDYIEPNMYSIMVNSSKEKSADIVVCGYKVFGDRVEECIFENREYKTDEAMCLLLKNRYMPSFLWNKLFKSELFHNKSFLVGYRYEDLLIMHELFKDAKKVVAVSEQLYFYYIREDSITGSTKYSKSGEFVDSLEQRCEDLKNSIYYDDALYGKFICIRRLVYEIIVNKEPKTEFYNRLITIEKECFKVISKNCSFTNRIVSKLFLFCPKLYAYLRLVCQKVLHK
ncbi:glycosyltransferase family 2 protein [Clostridium butyricum]|uniref:glycosyltransferase family 2 protein n=1 Tax=Clostridium butyricum TaxID=1492 RepID=UPI002ABE26CC|nr:glycosyltransferase [Clostridium butyricum]